MEGERIARNAEGEAFHAGADTRFEEWKEKQLHSGAESVVGGAVMPRGGAASGEGFDKNNLQFGAGDSILSKEGVGVLDFRRIEGEQSISQDLKAVNPKYGTGDEYNFNCGNCVAAYELRRRGIDVEAQPRVLMKQSEWASLFEGFSPQKPTSRTKAKVAEELEQKVLSWGEGARGTVFGIVPSKRKRELGHFFSVEVSEGKVRFVDSQNNMSDVKRYFDVLKPSTIVFGRLDNLEPNVSIINAVKAREVRP